MNTDSDITPENSTFVEQQPGPALKSNTVAKYEAVYNRFVGKVTSTLQFSPDEPITITPTELVEHWIASAPETRGQTGNLERAAILWVLNHNRAAGWEEAHKRLSAIRRTPSFLRAQRESNRPLGPTVRTRSPGKVIPEDDLNLIMAELSKGKTNGARAQWFLMAGIASGARPSEWIDAEWVDEPRGVLRIFTAKVKARNAWAHIPSMTFTQEDLDHELDQAWTERAPPDQDDAQANSASWEAIDFERRIASVNLTDEEKRELRDARYKNGVLLFRDVQIERGYVGYVSLHMAEVKTAIALGLPDQADSAALGREDKESLFERNYYNPVRHIIWRTCKKLFLGDDKLYSPTDTRDTFAANRKAVLGLAAAAGELGHSVTTSKDHYAPAREAWSKYSQKPSQSALQRPALLEVEGKQVGPLPSAQAAAA